MSTSLKIIGAIVGALLILIIAAIVYFAMNSNALVKRAIEAIGTDTLGVPVAVARVDLSLREGRCGIDGLTIANPPGFGATPALAVQSLHVALDVPASHQGLIVIERIDVAGASVAAQVGSDGKTNFSTILQHLESSPSDGASSSTDNVKLIVRHFDFTGASATAAAPLLDEPVALSIRDIHVNDIGQREGGLPPSEIGAALLRPVVAAVIGEMREMGVAGLRESVERKMHDSLNDKLKGGLDQLRELGHPEN
jgi:AsmA family